MFTTWIFLAAIGGFALGVAGMSILGLMLMSNDIANSKYDN